jgi:phosphoribosylamine--glycine ligase
MKVLIIGSGGREHGIALKLLESPGVELVIAPGNPGMESLGQCVPIDVSDLEGLLKLAKQENVELTVVGPEVPLVEGIADLFIKEGLRIFGPSAAAARLEGSKAFSKEFMETYQIPTAIHKTFTSEQEALSYLEAHPAPIVVKASGLAAGKGAIVCETQEQAVQAVSSMLGQEAIFGDAGREVVIEEFMQGEEASVFAICDGTHYTVLPTAQDHKRALDGDKGLNTGGMGAYSPAPIVAESVLQDVCAQVIEPTLKGMEQEGCPYKGVLYVGLMIEEKTTGTTARVVEFNCRLGDPEAQIILPNYQGDFLELLIQAADGTLGKNDITPALLHSEKTKHSAIVVLTAGGYPGSYEKGTPIQGLKETLPSHTQVLHAGTGKNKSGDVVTAGGRVLGLVGQGNSLEEALEKAYSLTDIVTFEDVHFRTDIGQKGLKRVL